MPFYDPFLMIEKNGEQLKVTFTKKDVRELLNATTIYPEEVRKRGEDVIYMQMEKYGYLFEE